MDNKKSLALRHLAVTLTLLSTFEACTSSDTGGSSGAADDAGGATQDGGGVTVEGDGAPRSSGVDAGRVGDADIAEATIDSGGYPDANAGIVVEHRGDLLGPADDAITYLAANASTGVLFNNIKGFAVDSTGGILVASTAYPNEAFGGSIFVRLSPSLTTVGNVPTIPNTVVLRRMTGDSAGNAYVTGRNGGAALPGETAHGGTDLVIGKYGSDGTQAWLHQVGGASDETGARVVAAGDGSVRVAGTTSGQLPGQPADTARKPFIMSFGSEGTLAWTAIVSVAGLVVDSLSLDPAGAAFVGSDEYLAKIDPAGIPGFVTKQAEPTLTDTALHSSSNRLYAFDGMELTCSDTVTGKILWYRKAHVTTATIDPVEGVIWHGYAIKDLLENEIVVTNDAIYTAGRFQNQYQNGSTPRPETVAAYIARYDLEGNQIWFKQFLPARTDAKAQINSWPAPALALDHQGNILAAVAYNTLFVWRVRAADGQLL